MANFNFGVNSWEMKVYYLTINQNYLRYMKLEGFQNCEPLSDAYTVNYISKNCINHQHQLFA